MNPAPVVTTQICEVTLPMRTVSEANARDHHMQKCNRVREQRGDASRSLARVKYRLQETLRHADLVVTLTRYGKQLLDEGDNPNGAFKAIRDGIADALNINDRDPRVRWSYAQEKSKVYAVRIRIARQPGRS